MLQMNPTGRDWEGWGRSFPRGPDKAWPFTPSLGFTPLQYVGKPSQAIETPPPWGVSLG